MCADPTSNSTGCCVSFSASLECQRTLFLSGRSQQYICISVWAIQIYQYWTGLFMLLYFLCELFLYP